MNKIKKVVSSTRKFVEDHKVAVAIIGTTLVWVKINKMALRSHDNFLKEHDLYEKFHSLEEY